MAYDSDDWAAFEHEMAQYQPKPRVRKRKLFNSGPQTEAEFTRLSQEITWDFAGGIGISLLAAPVACVFPLVGGPFLALGLASLGRGACRAMATDPSKFRD